VIASIENGNQRISGIDAVNEKDAGKCEIVR